MSARQTARSMRLFLALVLLALGSPQPVSVSTVADVLRDPSGAMTISQAAASRAFVPAAAIGEIPERNYTSVTWLRVRLPHAMADAAWGLKYSYKVTRVDVYVPAPSGYLHTAGGFDLAARDGALVPGYLVLPQRALYGKPFFVRVSSVIDPRSITVAPLHAIMPTALQRRAIFGIVVSFYLTIGVFFVLMFFGLRDRSFIDYSLVMAMLALQLMTSFGVMWQILPPISFLQRELMFDTFSMLFTLAFASFAIRFLRLSERDRAARAGVFAGTVVWFAIVAADFIQNAPLAFWMTIVANYVFLASLGFASLRAQSSGMRAARFFTWAIAANMIGYGINMGSPYLPAPEITVFAIQAGTIAASLLLALAVAGQVQERETQASRDGLTNVLNRRSFDTALSRLTQPAFAGRGSVGVLLIDIDHFKAFNDRFGHLAGDDSLIAVAQACAACMRSSDIFARFGGEEFAAIVPSATHEDLERIAQRMMSAVADLRIDSGTGSLLTVSIGGTLLSAPVSTDMQHGLRVADENLYSAKLAGRNRIVLA